MTIDKAIETLESFGSWFAGDLADRDAQAIKLGIEALKRVKAERTGYESYAPDLLPGETTD